MQKTVVQLLRAPAGGIRKHVLDIIDDQSNEKIKQIFITNLNDSDVDLSYLKNNKNVEVYHLDIKESPGFSDLKNLISIYKILKNKKVDVIHGHGAKGGLYARVIAPCLRAKCIYTPHGGSLHRVHGKIKNVFYDVIEKLMMPVTDVLLFESKYSSEIYKKNITDGGEKVLINYNGVSLPEEFAHKIYQAGNVMNFASFGLLRHLKGHDIFIECCHLLNMKKIPFTYTIYGSGDFEAELLLLIKKYNLESKIKILNYSPNVYQEMLKFDFIVHPSRFESFGYVPVEAMAVKIPVIASHEGGLKEVVDTQSGYIAYENSPESYLHITEALFHGDPELENKVEHAYERIQELFSKKAMISNIERVYLS